MDTKTHGIPLDVVKQTFIDAKVGRMKILDMIEAVIPAPRPELSKYAPRIESFHINPERIRDVIGPGGKMINEIIAQTGVQIDIEDDGLVMITALNPEGMKRAVDWVRQLTREIAVGEIFEGPVTRIMDFGAFVEIGPKQEGLVHISEIAPQRIGKVTDVLKIGDRVKVKVYEIDSMGRINLSIKRADPNYKESERDKTPLRGDRPPRSGGDRGGFGGRGVGGGGHSTRGPVDLP